MDAKTRLFVEPPGSRLPLSLASITHSLTLPHVVERVNLICAQQNVNPPARTVSSLLLLATQVRHCYFLASVL